MINFRSRFLSLGQVLPVDGVMTIGIFISSHASNYKHFCIIIPVVIDTKTNEKNGNVSINGNI